MNRKRYMISWVVKGRHGRDAWVMERKGKISSADIQRIECEIADKWEFDSPVLITNVTLLN